MQPRQHVLHHAGFTAATRRHGLDHADQESICPDRSRSRTVGNQLSMRGMKMFVFLLRPFRPRTPTRVQRSAARSIRTYRKTEQNTRITQYPEIIQLINSSYADLTANGNGKPLMEVAMCRSPWCRCRGLVHGNTSASARVYFVRPVCERERRLARTPVWTTFPIAAVDKACRQRPRFNLFSG